MDKFGFTLVKGRRIDYDSNDRSIAEYVSAHEPSFRICIECGCCAYTCPAVLPLVQNMKLAKHMIHQQSIKDRKK